MYLICYNMLHFISAAMKFSPHTCMCYVYDKCRLDLYRYFNHNHKQFQFNINNIFVCKIITEIIISVHIHRWMRLILSMLWMSGWACCGRVDEHAVDKNPMGQNTVDAQTKGENVCFQFGGLTSILYKVSQM